MPESTPTPPSAALAGGPSSPTIGSLAAALAKAQAQVQAASKDRTNPAFRSKYADLASVWDACREAITSNGLAIVQLAEDHEVGRVALRTILIHASGEFIQTVVSAPLGKNDAQAVGSALTYLRRYSLSAMVGVAPDDDDGNAATCRSDNHDRDNRNPFDGAPPRDNVRPPPREPTPIRPPANQPAATDGGHDPSWEADRAAFCARLGELGVNYDTVKAVTASINKPKPSQMNTAQRKALVGWLAGPAGKAAITAALIPTPTE